MEELRQTKPKDDILIAGEVPLRNAIPLKLDGYLPLFCYDAKERIRICAYVKEDRARYIDRYTISRDLVTLYTTDGWKIIGCYAACDLKFDAELLAPIRPREVRLGDYNAKHVDWMKTRNPTNTRGNILNKWAKIFKAIEIGFPGTTWKGRGDRYAPSRIDLVWTYQEERGVIVFENSKITNSDHDCISIAVPLPAQGETTKVDYTKVDWEEVANRIRRSFSPTTADRLDEELAKIIIALPVKGPNGIINYHLKEPSEIQKATKSLYERWRRSGGYPNFQKTNREKLQDFINRDIEKTLFGAEDPRLSKPSRQGLDQRPAPGPEFEDDAITTLLKTYHRTKPDVLPAVYMDILRRTKRPEHRKAADAIPIPNARKTSIAHPKHWGSPRLFNAISKILKRIDLWGLRIGEGGTSSGLGITQRGLGMKGGPADAMQRLLNCVDSAKKRGFHRIHAIRRWRIR